MNTAVDEKYQTPVAVERGALRPSTELPKFNAVA